MKLSEGSSPADAVIKIWGDYNAVGLSGESNDNCIYSLHRETLSEIQPREGLHVFVYENDIADDGSEEIFGYVCKLERIKGYNSQWRARPDEATWYRGPKSW